MKQLLLIVNPISGTKKIAKRLSEIVSVFNRADYDTHVYITVERGDATRKVRECGKDMDLIVCCGGDGTLNETITGIIEADLSVPLGYIPAGSTNDFSNTLKLDSDPIKAAGRIINGSPTNVDVGRFGSRYFTYIASFGAFTKASYATSQNAKNALGHLAYVLGGIQELSGITKKHARLELDDAVLEDDYIFGAVCNSTSVGGILTLAPSIVDLADGKFEVLLVRSPKDVSELSECIIALTNQTYECRMLTLRSASKIRITLEELSWSLDGERADGGKCIEIENLHNRIQFVL